MDRTELKQKKLFVKKELKITDNGLMYNSKDYEGSVELFFHFDSFTNEHRITTDTSPKVLKWGIIIALIGLIRCFLFSVDTILISIISGLGILAIGLLLIAYYFIFQMKNYLLMCEDGKAIYLIYNNPNKPEFEEFVKTFYKKRKECYREKYFYVDLKGDRTKEINRMKWLRDETIITKSEYEVVIDEINLKMS